MPVKPDKFNWMLSFENELSKQEPEMAKEIDWYYATQYYNNGFNPWAAALRYIDLKKGTFN